MSKKRMVIALGHKDLGVNLPDERIAVKKTASMISFFIEKGFQIALVFSNGPQVGMIHTAMKDLSKNYPDKYTKTPLSVCSAMSQGLIGYDLQNAIRQELMRRGIFKPVSTILTQTLVNPYDESFYIPMKTVGKYMDAAEAEEEESQGNEVIAAANGKFQRIVPSPMPKSIIEIDAIRTLLDADQIVIAAGGGGIPVMRQGTELKGAAAVIEKDYSAGLLAMEVDADILLITTSVEMVSIHYGEPNEQKIKNMTVMQAREYLREQHFEYKSMKPKIEAAVSFVEGGNCRRAIITTMECAPRAVAGEAGTIIE